MSLSRKRWRLCLKIASCSVMDSDTGTAYGEGELAGVMLTLVFHMLYLELLAQFSRFCL